MPVSGSAIRDRRRSAGLNTTELAYRAGVTAAAIDHFELGRRQPSVETLQRIASVLGCTLSELIEPVEVAS